MATTHWATDGTVSIDLESVSTTPKFALGTRVRGNNSSEWAYIYASAAIGQYAAVSVMASGTAKALVVANARLGQYLGIAQQALAAADYGFVALEGQILSVQTTGATAVGVRLYTSGTAGKVTSTAASTQAQIGGLTLISTASGTSASTAVCVARNLVVLDVAFIV